MTRKSHRRGSRSYVLFSIAATVYIGGIVAFSSWSYQTQKKHILKNSDETLVNAARTTREIIGTGRARGIILSGATNAPVYAQHQGRLNHFATVCDFASLAIATRSTNSLFYIIASNTNSVPQQHNPIYYGKQVPDAISHHIQHLMKPSQQDAELFDINDAHLGPVRVAVVYEPDSPQTGYAFLALRHANHDRGILHSLAKRKIAECLFLLIMAIPLVALYNRTHHRTARKLERLNARLRQEVELQRAREQELKDAISDLERFNAVSAGRESRVIELKAEVNELLKQLDEPLRYKTDY